jgi:serine/threonine protein kinase
MLRKDSVNKVSDFVRERDWESVHTVENLGSAILVESIELYFSEGADLLDELADVTNYLILLTNKSEINLSDLWENTHELFIDEAGIDRCRKEILRSCMEINLAENPEDRINLISNIYIQLSSIATLVNKNLNEILLQKIEKNEIAYPVDVARGSTVKRKNSEAVTIDYENLPAIVALARKLEEVQWKPPEEYSEIKDSLLNQLNLFLGSI